VIHLHAAARNAAGVFDNRPAMELYGRALAIARAEPAHVRQGDLAILLEELGDLVRRTGDAPRATSLFEEALGYLTASDDAEGVFRVRGKAALGHMVSGKTQVAGDLLGDTLQTLAAPEQPDSVAQTYYLLAQLRWHSGQYDEALAAAEKAHLAAQASGDVSHRARAYEALALACHARGEWQKGVEYELSRQKLAAPGFDVDEALDVHL
jgi:tetratricopeptide (TPR) repeat protein